MAQAAILKVSVGTRDTLAIAVHGKIQVCAAHLTGKLASCFDAQGIILTNSVINHIDTILSCQAPDPYTKKKIR